jgi:hypothetical protein
MSHLSWVTRPTRAPGRSCRDMSRDSGSGCPACPATERPRIHVRGSGWSAWTATTANLVFSQALAMSSDGRLSRRDRPAYRADSVGVAGGRAGDPPRFGPQPTPAIRPEIECS